MKLSSIYQETPIRNFYKVSEDHMKLLYDLLKERPAKANISHKGMPEYSDHCAFVRSRPYKHWFVVETEAHTVGAAYLTHNNEIGVGIFQAFAGHGYGSKAVELLLDVIAKENGGRALANINPENTASLKLFEKLGFKKIQETFERVVK